MKKGFLASFLWILFVASDIMMPRSAHAAEQKLYTVQGHRDPFVQLLLSGSRQAVSGIAGVENIDDILVEGVVMDADPKKSVVIVNGTMLRVGDEAGQVKVLEIQADGAAFSVNGIDGFKQLYQEK